MTTPIYNFPYPLSSEQDNVPTDMYELALAVENRLKTTNDKVDAGTFPTVVNGRWLKGVGGAAVWTAITPADVTGVEIQSNKGTANGYASLDVTGKVPSTQLPASSGGITKIFDSTVTGSDATSIDTGAGGIAAGYAVLVAYLYSRTDDGSAPGQAWWQFNNDSAANYEWQRAGGAGASSISSNNTADNGIPILTTSAANTAGAFAMSQITIHNYDNMSGWKSAISHTGFEADRTYQYGGTWKNTGAITRLAVVPLVGGKKLKVGSRLTIYVK